MDELALRGFLRGFDLEEGRVVNFEHTVATPLVLPEPPYRYQAVLLQRILALFVRRALVIFVAFRFLYFGVLFDSLVALTTEIVAFKSFQNHMLVFLFDFSEFHFGGCPRILLTLVGVLVSCIFRVITC